MFDRQLRLHLHSRIAHSAILSLLSLFCFPLLVVAQNICGSPSFRVPVSYDSMGGTQVLVGDFNNDGKKDLVSLGMVNLGDGAGGVAAQIPFTTPNGTVFIASGDFNLDGNLDLAGADTLANAVAIILGDGTGGFGNPSSFPTGGLNVQQLAVGDFNQDGKPDIAVANRSSQNVSLLLGDGLGNLMLAGTLAPGGFTNVVMSADFNADGKSDLAITASEGLSIKVSIYLSAGGGNFVLSTDVFVPIGDPSFVKAGDFNGDNWLDLAIGQGNNVAISLGNGSGSFAAAQLFFAVNFTVDGDIGDFNNDGKVDLVVGGFGSVSLMLGNGSGTFAAPTQYAAGPGRLNVGSGDLNGDGNADFVTKGNVGAVFLGDGSGSFAAARNFPTAQGTTAAVTADFNSDRYVDLAATASGNGVVSVLLNNGSGQFGPATDFQVGTFPRFLTSADINQDGKPDLIVSNFSSNNVSILLGNGSGGFVSAGNYPVGTGPVAITVSDFNQDAKLDLAVVNTNSKDISLLAGNGLGGFSGGIVISLPNNGILSSLAASDFNHDMKSDLAVVTSNSLLTFLGDGAGHFAVPSNYLTNLNPTAVATGDFNRDGHVDLAVVASGNTFPVVYILAGNQIGGFQVVSTRFTGLALPDSIAVGDLNDDGVLDVIVTSQNFNYSAAHLGVGNGSLGSPTVVVSGWQLGPIAVGDFNNDGKDDLGIPNNFNGSLTVVLSTTTCIADTSPPVISCDTPDSNWHVNNVNFSCQASDAGSGLANSADSIFTLSTNVPSGIETSNASTNSRTVCDVVGNCTSAGPLNGNKIDRKAPVIGITTPGSGVDYLLNQSVSAGYLCSDGGSGISSCLGTVVNGSGIDTATVGTKSFTVNTTDNVGNTATQTVVYTVRLPQLNAVGPAQIWLGLKNGNDVGTKFDLLAEALRNGSVIGSGQLNDVPSGGNTFNTAVLRTINLALPSAVGLQPGDNVSLRLSVRIAASSGRGNGTARLWFNDAAANSHFNASIESSSHTYYLLDGFLLGTNVGLGPKRTVDVTVNRNQGGNPFIPFGTWTFTF